MGSSVELHLQSCSSGLGSSDALLADVLGSTVATNGSGDHQCITISNGISNRFTVTNEIEANSLKEIEGIPRLKLILADWESKYKESRDRIERKENLSLNVKNEIYHLIGFFSVFQGVVLTTVSQASALRCHNWWGPFALSLLASITTLFGVCHKFYNFFEWKRATDLEVENSKVLKRQICNLKKRGKNFDFSHDAPDVPNTNNENISYRYYFLALLVILSILGFSAIILISCHRILCDPGSVHPSPRA